MTDLNWFAILVASIAAFAIGGIWYSPKVFLNAWLQDMRVEPDTSRHPARVFGIAFLFSLVSCIGMAVLLGGDATVGEGLLLGFVVGTGFVACSYGINYQFANRPPRALLIDGGYHVLQFLAYGAILGGWPT